MPAGVDKSHENFLEEVGPPFRKFHFNSTLYQVLQRSHRNPSACGLGEI